MITADLPPPNTYLEQQVVKKQEASPITICTTQKAGTHLLFLIFEELNIPIAKHDWKGHWMITYVGETPVNQLGTLFRNKRKFLTVYRDPRDWTTSMLKWMNSKEQLEHVKKVKTQDWLARLKRFKKLSFDDQLTYVLNPKPHQIEKYLHPRFANPGFDSMNKISKLMKLNLPNVLILKFEDLIGPKYGGNSAEAQLEAVKQIAAFADLSVTDERVKDVIEKTLGKPTMTLTDEPKKVGQWKKYFSQKHIELFKKRYNHLLLEFGYETDSDWDQKL